MKTFIFFKQFKAFILPSMCFHKSLAGSLGPWSVRMRKLVFLTGAGALLLGVISNLPERELNTFDFPTQIQNEYNKMGAILAETQDYELKILECDQNIYSRILRSYNLQKQIEKMRSNFVLTFQFELLKF